MAPLTPLTGHVCGPTFLQFPTKSFGLVLLFAVQKKKKEIKLVTLDSSYFATYNHSLNVPKDIWKRSKVWKDVAQITGVSSEWM